MGFAPDGDSIRFKAANDAHWDLLEGRPARLNSAGFAQLRFDAVDALETHYRTASGTVSQPKDLANAATDRVLQLLRIRNVEWTPTRWRVRSADDGTSGYILAQATERYRRPICFVYSGSPSRPDGSTIEISQGRLRRSINYRLINEGIVYPTFYKDLHYKLRETLTRAVVSARKKKSGIWKNDRTGSVTLNGPETITDRYPIMPKLFRRLMTHHGRNGTFDGFVDYLCSRREAVLDRERVQFTYTHEIVRQVNNRVSLAVDPENLIFLG
jgi:endonuclease YncB( thermonuclease family)